jgi:hypothetical protein
MKPDDSEDRISRIMNDPELVRKIIQSGINDALLKHKQADNPVCTLKDGKVIWIEPQDIVIQKSEILHKD